MSKYDNENQEQIKVLRMHFFTKQYFEDDIERFQCGQLF